MEAKVEKKGDVVLVKLTGRIDYESADEFRERSLKFLLKEKGFYFGL